VVVADGVTVVLPLGVTLPTFGVMVTVVALLVDQLNVLEAPGVMLIGLAAKRTICGMSTAAAPTVTVTVWLTVPLEPVAVRV
jgi:hypothetical protein